MSHSLFKLGSSRDGPSGLLVHKTSMGSMGAAMNKLMSTASLRAGGCLGRVVGSGGCAPSLGMPAGVLSRGFYVLWCSGWNMFVNKCLVGVRWGICIACIQETACLGRVAAAAGAHGHRPQAG